MPDSATSPSLATRPRAALPGFSCSWHHDGIAAARVHADGELDLATAPELGRAIAEAQAGTHLVLLDLQHLTFMDLTGATAVAAACRRAREAGRRVLVLHRSSPTRIHQLFKPSDQIDLVDLTPGDPETALCP